ncbi:MAG TPA: TonB-dependent receptor [Pseudacidobacterium sp.]|nr:TonB-dependent receptor [Pseudacidobacterium sp.]
MMLLPSRRISFQTIAVAFLFVVFLWLGRAIDAQTFRGGINGVVTDQAGAVISGAQVVATADDTQVAHTTITSSAGEFSFQDLPLGSYTVTASASGFQKLKVGKVTVTAGTIYTLPMKLPVASEATTVEVSAAGLALDTTTTTQTTVIPDKTVQDIPLNGRDFTQMIGLAPGFAGYSLGGYGSVNGTRANQVNWQIDGADNNDWWHNIPAVNQGGVENIAGVTLPIDSIAEFSLQTQSAPETGRNPGGTVNLVTKSGTNQLHGTAYYYERNQALAVVSPFVQGNPPLENVQWGASLGGPFWKDHTFWFANFEKQKFNIATGNAGTEPGVLYQQKAQALLQQYNVPVNSATNALLSYLWPADLVNSSVPASPNNFSSAAPEFGYSYNGVMKLDHTFNDRHSLSARAFLGQGNQTAPVGSTDVNPWYFEVGPIHVYNYSVAHNWVISPRMTNQVTIGVNYFNQTFSDAKTGFDVGSVGFVTNSPYSQAPNIQINGFESTGNTPPEGRNDITGHLDEAFSWTFGKHQLRFGGEYRQAQINEFYKRHSTGSFKFTGTAGPWNTSDGSCVVSDSNVCALADFMAGYLSLQSIVVGNPERFVYSHAFNLFAQDSWQLTSQLNINYGVRYDFMQPMYNHDKNLSVFRPGLTPDGLAFQGADISQVYPSDWLSISPRVGFSYQLSGNAGIVVRGGFGMFFDTPNANPFLDNRPGNSAPNGLEGNPGGSDPVYTLTTAQYSTTINGNTVGLVVPGQPIIQTTSLVCNASSQCGVFSVNKNFRSPYNFNFNLQIEKSLGSKATVQLGYVGSEGRRLLSLLNINQPYLGAFNSGYTGQYALPYQAQYPGYSDINQIESIGTSNYNSLQAVLRSNNWHGLTAQAAYTWGHNLDEVTAYRGALPQDSTNFKGDYGNSDFDTRNTFVGYANYDIPVFKGPSRLTHGWQVNTAFTFKGGQPITIYNANDTSGTNEYTQRVNQVANPFAGVSHKIITPVGGGTPYVQWFNPNAFVQPAANTWGTIARNSLYGPGFSDVDLSLFKNTSLTEKINTQLRAEIYNLFNRLNLANPGCSQLCNAYLGNGGFGTIGSTIGSGNYSPGIGPGEPFNVQLALKIIF